LLPFPQELFDVVVTDLEDVDESDHVFLLPVAWSRALSP
jgi:hypothetical protein